MKLAWAVACFVITLIADCSTLQKPNYTQWKDNKAASIAEANAAASRKAKMAAVDKVVSLLEDLTQKVLSEGESEARTYNKFACFCQETTQEKTSAVGKGSDEKTSLSTTIGDLENQRDGCDENIRTLLGDIKAAELTMKQLTETRKSNLAIYEQNDADLIGAIEAIEGATKVLKASGKPSFAQVQAISRTLQFATAMAEALGVGTTSLELLQSLGGIPEVPMEDYKFHSTSIIDTLEGLMADFRAEKNELDAEEVRSVTAFKGAMQTETDTLKRKNIELDDERRTKSQKHEEIAAVSEQLTTVAATLMDDKAYLQQLSKMCSDKAKTWDQRSRIRQDELFALSSATAIVKQAISGNTSAATLRLAQSGMSVRMAQEVARNPEAMEAVEAVAEAADRSTDGDVQATVGFLQRFSHRHGSFDDSRTAIVDLLRGSGDRIHSSLLTALARRIASDPFAKIKTLIQELIDRLLTEANTDANQKGWCDKSTADAEQKRDYASGSVEELNAKMAQLEALRDKLDDELHTLTADIDELKKKRSDAEAMRSQENAENSNAVQEAEAGLEAVEQAMSILEKFYKTAAKEKLGQFLQGPAEDAPDAGFKQLEAYTGSQGEAKGIIGMIEVIGSDFARTISETKKAEAQAIQDHLEFMTATGKSLAEKEVAQRRRTSQRDDGLQKLERAEDGLRDKMIVLAASVQELVELKKACVDTGMSYEERVARREDEIEALKKADCILHHYSQYGPDGAGDAC
jgi:outer membrane murein-binding lipoprotein Lpp/FtsZ-binding cell division protein ZapB